MVENPKKSSRAPKAGPTEQFDNMTAINGAAMEIFSQACQAYAIGFAAVNGELINFVNARLKHNVELGEALARCRNWTDAATLQQDWAQTASEEYLAEASRLMEVASKVTKDSWKPLSAGSEQAVGKPPKTTA